MKFFLYPLIFLTILFLISTAALRVFTPQAVFLPHLTLVLVVIFALNRSLPETIWFSFIAGFLSELFSGLAFGSQIFAFTMCGIAVYLLTRKITARHVSPPVVLLVVCGSTVAYYLFLSAASSFFVAFDHRSVLPLGEAMNWSLLWRVVANIVLFYPLNFVYKLLPKQDEGSI